MIFKASSDSGRRADALKTRVRTARGHKQYLARVAGGQNDEGSHESNKKHRLDAAVEKAVGNSRKRLERALGRTKN
jgi:hypothetical protein